MEKTALTAQMITHAALRGANVTCVGEYNMYAGVSAEMLASAYRKGVIDEETAANFMADFKLAKNAFEILETLQYLARRLFRKRFDYSGIIKMHRVLDHDDCAKLSRTIRFGNGFMEPVDLIDVRLPRTCNVVGFPSRADLHILALTHRMPEKSQERIAPSAAMPIRRITDRRIAA